MQTGRHQLSCYRITHENEWMEERVSGEVCVTAHSGHRRFVYRDFVTNEKSREQRG